MFGLLNIDKATGLTSRQIVDRVWRVVRPAKAGHAGTLDPLATGVLIVCVGPATRLISSVQEMPKSYTASFLLGRRSDTDDVEGEVEILEQRPHVSRTELEEALEHFVGEIQQTPPQYSAVKIGGRRAYDLARQGREAKLSPRTVRVDRIELLAYDPPELTVEIECGSGTYVRAIGRDLGASLGCGAVMSALMRSRIGPFGLGDAIDTSALEQMELADLQRVLLPPAMAVGDWPTVQLEPAVLRRLRNGRAVELDERVGVEGVSVAVEDYAGNLIALAEWRGGRLLPRTVFPE